MRLSSPLKGLLVLVLLTALSVVFSACAQQSGSPSRSPVAPASPGSAPRSGSGSPTCFLWEVRSAAATVHLLGSVHFGKAGFYPLNPRISKAYEESDAVAVEINVADLSTFARLQGLVMQKGYYPPGENLKDHLPARLYSKLSRELGPWVKLVGRARPWFVSMTVTQLRMKRWGYRAQHGIDMYFLRKALKERKPILELESIDLQIGLFAGLPADVEVFMLEESLSDERSARTDMDRMVQCWQRGDTSCFEKLLNKSSRKSKRSSAFHEKLMTARNRTMARKIAGYLRSGSYKKLFIVVGAGHLVGTDSIVALLSKQGYHPIQQ